MNNELNDEQVGRAVDHRFAQYMATSDYGVKALDWKMSPENVDVGVEETASRYLFTVKSGGRRGCKVANLNGKLLLQQLRLHSVSMKHAPPVEVLRRLRTAQHEAAFPHFLDALDETQLVDHAATLAPTADDDEDDEVLAVVARAPPSSSHGRARKAPQLKRGPRCLNESSQSSSSGRSSSDDEDDESSSMDASGSSSDEGEEQEDDEGEKQQEEDPRAYGAIINKAHGALKRPRSSSAAVGEPVAKRPRSAPPELVQYDSPPYEPLDIEPMPFNLDETDKIAAACARADAAEERATRAEAEAHTARQQYLALACALSQADGRQQTHGQNLAAARAAADAVSEVEQLRKLYDRASAASYITGEHTMLQELAALKTAVTGAEDSALTTADVLNLLARRRAATLRLISAQPDVVGVADMGMEDALDVLATQAEAVAAMNAAVFDALNCVNIYGDVLEMALERAHDTVGALMS